MIIRADTHRYVVRPNDQRGIVTLYWRGNERDEREDEFRVICNELAAIPTNRRVNYSCSATIALYTDEQCVQRLHMWAEWHQLWVYGVKQSIPSPPSMPLPGDSAPPLVEHCVSGQAPVPPEQVLTEPGGWNLFEDVEYEDDIVDCAVSESCGDTVRSDTSSLTSDVDSAESQTDEIPYDDVFERHLAYGNSIRAVLVFGAF